MGNDDKERFIIMEQTTNLGLNKPSFADAPDISVFNKNMDILDEKVQECLDNMEIGELIIEE